MIGLLIGAWLDVRSKPLRTFAAIAGLIAAVVAVILVDAAAILSLRANDEYLARTYGRTVTLSVFPSGNVPLNTEESRVVAADLVTSLRDHGVERVSTNVTVALVLIHDERLARTNAQWVSSTYPDVSIIDLVAGEFPVATAQSDVLHAVITLDIAQQLGFSGADAIGQTIGYVQAETTAIDLRTTTVRPLVVDAVAESSRVAFGDSGVLLVSDLDRPDLLGEFQTRSWLVHVHPVDVGLVTEVVENVLAGPNQAPVFLAFRIDEGANLAPVLEQQGVTARAVTLVALVVGGLGIFGVGLASVRERGMDFGLRRALGASTAKVFTGVITQTLLEVLLAAVIAIPIAAVALELFSRQLVLATLPLPESTALPLSSAARGLVAALAVGLVAGLLPAVRAARTSVAQALRD